MKKGKLLRIVLVVPLMLLLFVYYTTRMRKQIKRINRVVVAESGKAGDIHMQIAVKDNSGETHAFLLGKALSVTRESGSGSFTTLFTSAEIEDDKCKNNKIKNNKIKNNKIKENKITQKKITQNNIKENNIKAKPQLKDIPMETFSGLVYLMDLSDMIVEPGRLISRELIHEQLEQIAFPVSMLAIKTGASALPQDGNYLQSAFLSLSRGAAAEIHDYRFSIFIDSQTEIRDTTKINCLILDIPYLAREKTPFRINVLHHFFSAGQTGSGKSGQTGSGKSDQTGNKRIMVESVCFNGLKEGYYYATINPPRKGTTKTPTGITFRPLLKE
ncbi:MAG: hypothetical protein GY757_49435 [bacterium]|nr:hypothetical protein [bacterium]